MISIRAAGVLRAASTAAILTAAVLVAASPAQAQTIESYGCADGTRFTLGFFPHDSRAFIQINGTAVTLKRRLTLSGRRYSGGGVSLFLTDGSTRVKFFRRHATECVLT